MKGFFDIEDEGTTTWCESCQMWNTINRENEYGTCMCS